MKTLYLECNMGAAGDMLTAALLELVSPAQQQEYLKVMNSIPGVEVRLSRESRCGIQGCHVTVLVHGEEEHSGETAEHHGHHHTGMEDIRRIVGGLELPDEVKRRALHIYGLIAAAESHAHGLPVEEVHFHEVGAMDAVVDVTGCCLLLYWLHPERIVVSPIHLGSGTVRCAHGILPVPAPATAYILQGVPCYGGSIQGELCTPTGAAILKSIAHAFGPMPAMSLQAAGIGTGSREFEQANILRAFLGESQAALHSSQVLELSCNIDDMTGEELAFAAEKLMEGGALDVYSRPMQMKKGRPAVMLCCLCRPEDQAKLCGLMLEHTTSWGLRMTMVNRVVLPRSTVETVTPYGRVRVKYTALPRLKAKTEYEDTAAAARRAGVPYRQVEQAALEVFYQMMKK